MSDFLFHALKIFFIYQEKWSHTCYVNMLNMIETEKGILITVYIVKFLVSLVKFLTS